MRVAIAGAPGAGKTTLAADVTAELRHKGLPAELVSEFAREFIVANGGIDSAYEQIFVAREQKRREETLSRNSKLIVISDSPYLMNYVYAAMLCGGDGGFYRSGLQNSFRTLNGYARIMMELVYDEFLDAIGNYDLIVYAERPASVAYQKDGVRVHDEEQSARIDKMIRAVLDMHGRLDLILGAELCRSDRSRGLVEMIEIYSGGRK